MILIVMSFYVYKCSAAGRRTSPKNDGEVPDGKLSSQTTAFFSLFRNFVPEIILWESSYSLAVPCPREVQREVVKFVWKLGKDYSICVHLF